MMIIKSLGKGKYSEVFLGQDKQSGFLFAIKTLSKKQLINEEMEEQFSNEIRIQR